MFFQILLVKLFKYFGEITRRRQNQRIANVKGTFSGIISTIFGVTVFARYEILPELSKNRGE